LASSSGPHTLRNRVRVDPRRYHGRLPLLSFIFVPHGGPWRSVDAIPIQTAAFQSVRVELRTVPSAPRHSPVRRRIAPLRHQRDVRRPKGVHNKGAMIMVLLGAYSTPCVLEVRRARTALAARLSPRTMLFSVSSLAKNSIHGGQRKSKDARPFGSGLPAALRTSPPSVRPARGRDRAGANRPRRKFSSRQSESSRAGVLLRKRRP